MAKEPVKSTKTAKSKPTVKRSKPPISQFTPKQSAFIKAKAKGVTNREACKIAHLNECYASTLLKEPKVIESIQDLMAKHGLDDDSILKVHSEMIKATRGEDESPDWQTRSKGVELAYKLKGAFIEKKEVTFPEGLNIKVSFHGRD